FYLHRRYVHYQQYVQRWQLCSECMQHHVLLSLKIGIQQAVRLLMVADRYRIDKQSVFQIAKSISFTRFIEQLMERAHENLFLKSAAILLGVTAAAKLISATGSAKIL